MLIFHEFLAGNGRRPSFGNNLFCYFTLQIIMKECGHTQVESIEMLGDNYMTIQCKEWSNFFEIREKMKNSNIFLQGFFQNSEIIEKFKPFVKSLINGLNNDRISPLNEKLLKVCNIYNAYRNIEKLDKSCIILHLRLDDFNHNGGQSSEIIHPSCYFNILDEIDDKETIVIVTDKPRVDFEFAYIDLFKKKYPNSNILIQNEDYLKDFVFLMKATRLIVSNSTFCWLAGF